MADDDYVVRTITGKDRCPACQHVANGDFDSSRHVHSCRRETPDERQARIDLAQRAHAADRAYEQALEARYRQ